LIVDLESVGGREMIAEERWRGMETADDLYLNDFEKC
jgi:hypothetical protein